MPSEDDQGTGRGLAHTFFSVGARRQPSGWLQVATTAYAAALALWVLYAAAFAIIDPLALGAIFLSFMMGLLFLMLGPRPSSNVARPNVVDAGLAAASIACGVFYAVNADTIVVRISLLDPLSPYDIAFGTVLWVLAIEATRRAVGLALTLIVVVFVLYNLFGHLLGGVMAHGKIGYLHFLDQTMFTTNAIFGAPVRVAATYAFLFVTFGTLLERSGGGDFFFNLASAISGHKPGGPAKVAVFSSALFGTISGSPTSDVVTTGSITIPMMRRLGYPRALAGAVEVAASTSGGILPPVMGSAAFIMVEFTGIDYRTIILAAIVPGILYVAGVYAQVHFRSMKLGLRGMDRSEIPALRTVVRDGGLFVVPLATLIVALVLGYAVTYVAVFAIVSVVVVATLRRSTRMSPRDIYHALATTTLRMVPVTAACAAAGLVVGGISMTGLSGKFAYLVYAIAGHHLLIALLVSGVICILLGMGMPTPSAYIMGAVLVGPVLVDHGMTLLSAHMFLLFFAVLSAITPPVAVAAYAASSIADANPLLIGALAVRMVSTAFILPFLFHYSPELLAQGDPFAIVVVAVRSLAGVIALAAASEGFIERRVPGWQRIVLAVGGLALLMPGPLLNVAGIALVAPVALPHLLPRLRGGK